MRTKTKISYEIDKNGTRDNIRIDCSHVSNINNINIPEELCKYADGVVDLNCSYSYDIVSLPYFKNLESLQCIWSDIKRMYYYPKLRRLYCNASLIFEQMSIGNNLGVYHSRMKRLIVLTQWVKKVNNLQKNKTVFKL